MKVTIDRTQFRAALQIVAPVVNPRSPSKAASCVKFVVPTPGAAEEVVPELIAANIEIGIRQAVTGLQVHRPGVVLLSPAKMLAILTTSRDSTLELELNGTTLHVTGSRSRHQLPTEDLTGFPDVPAFRVVAAYHLWADELRRGLRRTTFAAEKFRQNTVVNGVLWETIGEEFTMVGIGSAAMACDRLAGEAEGELPDYRNGDPTHPAPVLAPSAIKLIERVIPDDSNIDVALSFADPNKVLIRAEGTTIVAGQLEGRYPDYRGLFDRLTGDATALSLAASELRGAIEEAMVSATEESRGLQLGLTTGSLRLACRAADAGQSEIDLPVDYLGAPLSFAIDPSRGLLDGLRAVGDDQKITIELRRKTDPIVVTLDDGYRFIVMPMNPE